MNLPLTNTNAQHPMYLPHGWIRCSVFDVGCWMFAQLAGTVPGVPSHRLLPRAVVAFAVQVNQDFARFGAFALADDTAIFQFIHDARGPAVAEAQATLQ